MPKRLVETPDVEVVVGDCLRIMTDMEPDSFDSVVTDPPWGIGFMGKEWDTPGAFVERKPAKRNRFDHVGGNHNPIDGFDQARTRCVEGRKFGEWCERWAPAVSRLTRPGGYMLAMGGSRTYHRLTCAIEDAGWEIRDCIMWMYGTGFPKSKGGLKPCYEPIVLARKPGPKVLPLGIDECRVPCEPIRTSRNTALGVMNDDGWKPKPAAFENHPAGRWPANLCHDGSEEVLDAFAAFGESSGRASPRNTEPAGEQGGVYGLSKYAARHKSGEHYGDTGTAARFYYCAKASKAERGEGNGHPTVKPIALMRWLVRLVTPPGGRVFDPFCGSGSTLLAAREEGRRSTGIEISPEYAEIAKRRLGIT